MVVAGVAVVVPFWVAVYQFGVGTLLAAVVVGVVYVAAVRVPLLRVDERIEMVTEKSPERVRGEFLDGAIPLIALERERADWVERYDGGIELGFDPTLWFSGSVRYDAERRPDGSVVVYGGRTADEAVVVVEVVEDGDRTIVVNEGAAGRLSLARVFGAYVRFPHLKAALRLQGYELVDSKTRFSVLG